MNNHEISDGKHIKTAFIDSGTTFTYVPRTLFTAFWKHFDWFCNEADPFNNCKGQLLKHKKNEICFSYSEDEFPDGPYEYFLSYPVLRFAMKAYIGSVGPTEIFNWYPSEYLYRATTNSYCVAIDIDTNSY